MVAGGWLAADNPYKPCNRFKLCFPSIPHSITRAVVQPLDLHDLLLFLSCHPETYIGTREERRGRRVTSALDLYSPQTHINA